ncbi:MAG: SDR family oxidoreductase [Verrucomicrobia bacterium]|nr:SDR family oxidoreductase [Verrucomicrobiota bacterium]MDA1087092.1 SDR family oxidoreductase [Verrucomicrobiota bacterium]
MQIDLTNKVAVVTGASGELGRVISRTLADCGAAVAVHYFRGEERARAVVNDIHQASGRAIAVQADVTDQASVLAMRDSIGAQLGTADIIVNNAVHQYDWTSVLEQDPADYESQFRTCTLHNVLMAKAFVPAMIEKRWGRVIAINTECTMQSGPSMSAYISGKGGQDRLLRVLAKEIGEHQITVNQVAPGWMISDRYRETPADDAGYRAGVPLRRRGYDQDIANTVAFVASDLAEFISGAYIPVCGGNVMPTV